MHKAEALIRLGRMLILFGNTPTGCGPDVRDVRSGIDGQDFTAPLSVKAIVLIMRFVAF